jgi:hypothetical protein
MLTFADALRDLATTHCDEAELELELEKEWSEREEKVAAGDLVIGENGHAELSAKAMGSTVLALFDKLVRFVDSELIKELLANAVAEAKANNDVDLVKSLFMIAFQTRWCRGGKGEKMVFYELFIEMYQVFPKACLELLDLIPVFGYWKDLFLLLEIMMAPGSDSVAEPRREGGIQGVHAFRERVWDVCAKQHREDMALINQGQKAASMYSKYVPSEKSQLDKSLGAVRALSKRLFPDEPRKAKALFRKQVSAMRASLDVTERKMCSKSFSTINFAGVPSLCLKRNVAAFLNIKVNGSMDLARHPLDQDRVDASHKFALASTEGKLNGKQLYPHELVRDLSGHGDVAKQFIAKSLWPKVVQNVINQIQERRKDLSELQAQDAAELLGVMGVQPGNILCMSDVSASMSGEPMDVSIALGILCSEIASPAFKDLVMTFSQRPTLISLADCEGDIMRKVSKVRNMHWGMSTDFHKAMECIVTIVLEKKLTQSEIPTLLVVSDMQFNEASGRSNKTQEAHSLIEQRFAQIGKELHGTPLLPPTIV